MRRHADRAWALERARDPENLLPIFEGAAQQFAARQRRLGVPRGAQRRRVDLRHQQRTGDRRAVGQPTRPARPGRCRSGSAAQATDNWDTIVGEIPPNLPGGVQPPSVYNEVDAVYGAAALLQKWGAPGDWQAALVAWNNYPPEIAQVTQLVAQYTHGAASSGTAATPGATTSTRPFREAGCVPVSGPTTPGAVAKILPNGPAAIPTARRPRYRR